MRMLKGGPDTGMMDINHADNYAKHEFAHMLGTGDRGDRRVPNSGPFVLSNTWPGRRPGSATAQDYGWGVLDAVNSVSARGAMINMGLAPATPQIYTQVTVGAPLFGWWK
jgi:hypothetical protein